MAPHDSSASEKASNKTKSIDTRQLSPASQDQEVQPKKLKSRIRNTKSSSTDGGIVQNLTYQTDKDSKMPLSNGSIGSSASVILPSTLVIDTKEECNNKCDFKTKNSNFKIKCRTKCDAKASSKLVESSSPSAAPHSSKKTKKTCKKSVSQTLSTEVAIPIDTNLLEDIYKFNSMISTRKSVPNSGNCKQNSSDTDDISSKSSSSSSSFTGFKGGQKTSEGSLHSNHKKSRQMKINNFLSGCESSPKPKTPSVKPCSSPCGKKLGSKKGFSNFSSHSIQKVSHSDKSKDSEKNPVIPSKVGIFSSTENIQAFTNHESLSCVSKDDGDRQSINVSVPSKCNLKSLSASAMQQKTSSSDNATVLKRSMSSNRKLPNTSKKKCITSEVNSASTVSTNLNKRPSNVHSKMNSKVLSEDLEDLPTVSYKVTNPQTKGNEKTANLSNIEINECCVRANEKETSYERVEELVNLLTEANEENNKSSSEIYEKITNDSSVSNSKTTNVYAKNNENTENISSKAETASHLDQEVNHIEGSIHNPKNSTKADHDSELSNNISKFSSIETEPTTTNHKHCLAAVTPSKASQTKQFAPPPREKAFSSSPRVSKLRSNSAADESSSVTDKSCQITSKPFTPRNKTLPQCSTQDEIVTPNTFNANISDRSAALASTPALVRKFPSSKRRLNIENPMIGKFGKFLIFDSIAGVAIIIVNFGKVAFSA